MKRTGCLAIVAASLVAVANSAASSQTRISVVLPSTVTDVWDANSCCVVEHDLAGRVRIPSLGRFRFVGEYDFVTAYVSPTPQVTTVLSLTFTSTKGDTIVIRGNSLPFGSKGSPPASRWWIADATGRLSRTCGSGSYLVTGPDTRTLTLSLALRGVIERSNQRRCGPASERRSKSPPKLN